MILTIIVFLLVLSVLVLIHEAGHYFVAKWLGIKVEEFGFGFPPKALSIKRGETEYSINWLPIGGFVKLYGEDEAGAGRISTKSPSQSAKKEVNRAFFARPVWQRAAVVVAGVVMNALLAIAIFYAFLHIAGYKAELPLLTEHKFIGANQENYNLNDEDTVVSVITPNSPASKTKMVAPIQITGINNKELKDRKAVMDAINANKGKEITLHWKELKTNKEFQEKVTPRVNPPEGEGALGIGFFPITVLSYDTPAQKAFSGVSHTYNVTAYTVNVMAKLVQISFEKRTAAPVSEGVSGPLGIGVLVGEILKLPSFKEQVLGLLNLAGLLSVSLAFFNILPIPALDGGRFFFILIEGLTGKKVNEKYEGLAHTIGMAVLLTLIAAITFRDVVRIFFGS